MESELKGWAYPGDVDDEGEVGRDLQEAEHDLHLVGEVRLRARLLPKVISSSVSQPDSEAGRRGQSEAQTKEAEQRGAQQADAWMATQAKTAASELEPKTPPA